MSRLDKLKLLNGNIKQLIGNVYLHNNILILLNGDTIYNKLKITVQSTWRRIGEDILELNTSLGKLLVSSDGRVIPVQLSMAVTTDRKYIVVLLKTAIIIYDNKLQPMFNIDNTWGYEKCKSIDNSDKELVVTFKITSENKYSKLIINLGTKRYNYE